MEATKKNESNKVYKIQLKYTDVSLFDFATTENLDEAIGLALMLHAKSNLPHCIYVVDSEAVHVVLNLYPQNECK